MKTSRWRVAGALVVCGALMAGLGLGPAQAAPQNGARVVAGPGEGDDPGPPEFPVVEKPEDKETGTPDPGPPEWPVIVRSESDAAGDPLAPAWPAPVKR